MTEFRIMVADKLGENGLKQLREAGCEVDTANGLSEEQLLACIAGYDALIVRSATHVSEKVVAAARRLKVIGRAGVGVDNINIEACTRQGIVVVNTPQANNMAAGELAVALACNLFRPICLANARAHQDDFRKALLSGSEMEGKTAAVIGLGRIGSIVARKLKGLGMRVIGYDQYVAPERFERLGIERIGTLEELLPQADLITLHTPKTKETVNILSRERQALCKKGVRIVNAARGGLLDEAALYDNLKSGQVAGAAIDVLTQEPDTAAEPGTQHYQNPLLELPQVIITPHIGASTKEASTAVSAEVADAILRVLNGELVAAINLPRIGGSIEEMAPFVDLAEKLGSIYVQTETQPLKEIAIEYSGSLVREETALLTLSVLKGFLTPLSENRITFVNVKQRVEEMGITISEKKLGNPPRFENLITVRFCNQEKTLSVSGTVLSDHTALLTDFYGYQVDFTISPYILAVQNDDVPGVIGRVGTALGEAGINIETLHWASKPGSRRAEALLGLDKPVDQQVQNLIKALPGVRRLSELHLG
ncbi:phosphoglycerate dehydrogenase [Oscillospiraceae bacterium HV4-5-C5C]|nr:phosphoglycerate dehydrogenase [Oscillospiraceae bacterium HV4-5-C5C]